DYYCQSYDSSLIVFF
nr:immunoglobulin light chain junction region [Macaca mulatta]MOW15498.1 immunoglobulin light chain junction region [Macaca mulatta]